MAASFSCLESLTDGDGVNGDGELVDHDDDGEHNGDGDAGKVEVPASNGAPVPGHEDLTSDSGAGKGDGGGSEGLLGGIGDAAAVSLLASRLVVGEGVVDADEAKEGDHQGDEDEGGDDEEGHAEHVHAEEEEELVADSAGKADHQEDGEEAREDEGDEDESLEELGSAPHGGGGVVGGEGGGLGGASGADAVGDSVEGPGHLGGVDGDCKKERKRDAMRWIGER